MPCYRCAARQTDPARGASPWKRGVVRGEQVLACPDCQGRHDWTADLDRCARCGSTALEKRLGDMHCRSCGADGPPETLAVPAASGDGASGAAPATSSGSLADEVAAALARVFDRGAE